VLAMKLHLTAAMNKLWIKRLAFAGLGVAGASLASAAVTKRRERAFTLEGRTVLITGGSRGLGFALAKEFGRHNCSVAICARTQDQLERARQMLEQEGIRAASFVCDVSDSEQVTMMMRHVRERFGPIDIVVNNAGQILVGPVDNMTEQDFRDAMDVMFWGPLNVSLAAIPEMRQRGKGSIVNVSSIGGKVAVPHLLPYCCAKFALVALSEGLRAELATHGIKVTTIAPWLMRTGGEVNAEFKGHAEAEANWFSASAGNPMIAMTAEKAAREIVKAVISGRSELILSPQGDLLSRVNGAMPGLVPNILGLVNRLLPAPAAEGSSTREKGVDLIRLHGRTMQMLTASGRRAGERLNQVTP
jgi:NAD(P)-dependent dehydrogenase (short-subunit alcohol dehydrogenase family)